MLRLLSPLGATPAPHNSSKMDYQIPEPVVVPHHHHSPVASSSSDTGESSGSDSDSSSDDTGDENPPFVPNRVSPPVVPVEPTHASLKLEESKPRWNLASYIGNGVNKESPNPHQRSPVEATSPLRTITSSILPLNPKKVEGRNHADESDGSESTKDLDRVVAEVLANKPFPLLSSLSDSDGSDTKRKSTKRRKRVPPPVPTNNASDSEDSDSDRDINSRSKLQKPTNRVSPISKPVDSNLSESEPENNKQFANSASDLNNPRLTAPPVVSNPAQFAVKPKSNRGRPRKEPEARGKKRGRPPVNKARYSNSGSENEQPVRRRGRPPLKSKPPPSRSSSDDDEHEKSLPVFEKPTVKPSRQTVYSSSSESDDLVTSRGKRRSESDRDSVKFGSVKNQKKHKTSRSEDKLKRVKNNVVVDDDDDEWAKKSKSKLRDNQTNDIKQKPPDTKKKERGKGRSNSNFKSLEYIPSDIDSDSDSADSNKVKKKLKADKLPIKRNSRASSISDSDAPEQRSSDSDNDMQWKMEDKLGSPSKLDGEKSEQDKKKGATLRKLFVTTRASDGGKGGGKGGKGGKGKGGVNVIILDDSNNYNYEHSSSSVEDDPMLKFPTNPTLLSPIPKREDSKPPIVSKETKSLKTAEKDNFVKPSVIVKIDLNRLSHIPKAVKRRLDEVRQTSFNTKQEQKTVKTTSEAKQCDSECEIVENVRTSTVVVIESDSECSKKWKVDKEPDSIDESVRSKVSKRKRRPSGSSLSSLSTVSSISLSERRKEARKEKDNRKTKRRKDEEENVQRSQSNSSSFTNVPPTNHEREGAKTLALPSPDCNSATWTAKAPVYYSYFERLEPSDDEDK